MKKTGLILLIILVASLTACASPYRQPYEKNLALWKSQSINHYRFDLRIGCMCPWSGMMPVAVEVQNGAILSMTASNGGDITPYLDTFRPRATVENLFATVDTAISKRVYQLTVHYDAKYGFPASIVVNPSKAIMDDETGYYVTNFEVLP